MSDATIRPCGYYVLVKMEKVEQVTASGIVISTNSENQREQDGHDIGTLVSLGPTAYCGFQGTEGLTAEVRAAKWGVKVGDKVEFNRYDGKIPSNPNFSDYRTIQDGHINCVIED